MTDEQIEHERVRRSAPWEAASLIDGVRRGYYLHEAATRKAIWLLMVGSHARRCGELPALPPLLGEQR